MHHVRALRFRESKAAAEPYFHTPGRHRSRLPAERSMRTRPETVAGFEVSQHRGPRVWPPLSGALWREPEAGSRRFRMRSEAQGLCRRTAIAILGAIRPTPDRAK